VGKKGEKKMDFGVFLTFFRHFCMFDSLFLKKNYLFIQISIFLLKFLIFCHSRFFFCFFKYPNTIV
jgi:hypothetical protein